MSEALAALIRGYARGDFASSDLVWRKSPSGESGEVDVIVTLEGPIPTARIEINSHRGQEIPERDHVELNYRRKLPATKTKFVLRKRGEDGDLVQMRAFTDYTLKTVAALFADKANMQGKS